MSQADSIEGIITALVEGGVDFILVGGLAVGAWGFRRGTEDVDLVPEPSGENIERLVSVLEGLDPRLIVLGEELPGSNVRLFVRAEDRALVATRLGKVDILQNVPQIPSYRELLPESTEAEVFGHRVKVCSLRHLLEMKRAAGRPQDLFDIERLEIAHPLEEHGPERDEDEEA